MGFIQLFGTTYLLKSRTKKKRLFSAADIWVFEVLNSLILIVLVPEVCKT